MSNWAHFGEMDSQEDDSKQNNIVLISNYLSLNAAHEEMCAIKHPLCQIGQILGKQR